MKKTLQIIILIIILGAILILLSGCKKKEENININKEEDNEVITTNVSPEDTNMSIEKTKIKEIFDKIFLSKNVYIKYKMKIDEGFSEPEDAMVTYAIKDNTIYVDTLTSSNRATVIQTQDKVYAITHTTKTYVEFEKQEGMQIDNLIDKKVIEKPSIKTGKETLNNVEYDYEELLSDGEYNRFYFIKGTDTLKYWKLSDGQLLEIEEYGTDIDNSWFELLSQYKKESLQDNIGDHTFTETDE